MKELKDYFVTHEQAVSLNELGFKDECLAWYRENGDFNTNLDYKHLSTKAPLIAQAMDWLTGELNVHFTSVNDGIEKLKALRKKVTVSVTLTFEVYQASKTYEDDNYLIILKDEYYPISVAIVYGQMVDSNGANYNDENVAFISPSFEVIK